MWALAAMLHPELAASHDEAQKLMMQINFCGDWAGKVPGTIHGWLGGVARVEGARGWKSFGAGNDRMRIMNSEWGMSCVPKELARS